MNKFMLLALALFSCGSAFAHAGKSPEKTVLIPKKVRTIPENNDFTNNDSEYSNSRKAETKNFILYWSKEYGQNPLVDPAPNKRFNVPRLMVEAERYYDYYVTKLHITGKNSVVNKHKILILVNGGDGGTAYGWGQDSVGIFWTPASRINKEPYGVVAHELGHVFQFLVETDNGGQTITGPINEMGAQYLLWQVLPNWFDFENFHLKAYQQNTHLAFSCQANAYHAPFMFEYWAEKHGKDFYGKILNNAKQRGEDVITIYKKITGVDQAQLNDEFFDAARKFVTWDLKRINKIAAPYRNQFSTKLNDVGDGWQEITPENCPENYGYNAIKLAVPNNGKVSVDFKGLLQAKGFNNVDTTNAGWRYGFLAYKENGSRVYGKVYNAQDGNAEFSVPSNTEYLWLVVMGAPKTYMPIRRRQSAFAQMPYRIKLTGTKAIQ